MHAQPNNLNISTEQIAYIARLLRIPLDCLLQYVARSMLPGSCNRVAKHGCVNLRCSLCAFDQTSIQTTLINF